MADGGQSASNQRKSANFDKLHFPVNVNLQIICEAHINLSGSVSVIMYSHFVVADR